MSRHAVSEPGGRRVSGAAGGETEAGATVCAPGSRQGCGAGGLRTPAQAWQSLTTARATGSGRTWARGGWEQEKTQVAVPAVGHGPR